MFNQTIIKTVSAIAIGAAMALSASSSARAFTNESPAAFFAQDARLQKAGFRLDGRPARQAPVSTRQVVADPTGQSAGTITVNTAARKLYLSLGNGKAMQYSIGVGRPGFQWSGIVRIGRKAEWPAWTPPPAMRKRRPDLPLRMEGGIDNPLGARAMYLYKGNKDSMFRIHGTSEPDTIGQAVSSGCIRMLNEDVKDLYKRAKVGARVRVL